MSDLDSKVFRNAANTIVDTFNTYDSHNGLYPYACDYLPLMSQEKTFFKKLFEPEPFKFCWWGDFTKKNQLARAIALDLCAEMLEEEPKLKVEDIPW